MVLSMKVSGIPRLNKDMVEDIKGMLTVLYMKDTGRMTKLMGEEESSN